METTVFKILVIEDAPEDARLIRDALANPAVFHLIQASRLSEGLAVLDAQLVDLILLDVTLPDGDGVETVAKVRAHSPRVPMVVLLGTDDEAVGARALEHGAQDYLVKRSLQAYPNLLSRSIRYAIERKRADELKDEFVSMVSHELRTPLTTIREFTGILADKLSGPLTGDQQSHLGIIQMNIDRLTRMIDSLLDVAKIETGTLLLNRAIVDSKALVEHAVETFRVLAANKQVELAVDLPARPPEVFADADKLAQVFINLIGNALKFTRGPGRITVRMEEAPNEVIFHVADTGCGISADDFPRLFQKFQQGRSPAGEKPHKGTGLGLAISKRLVELHGGRIWAASAIGQGSTFSFSLPRYNADELFHEYFKTGIQQAKERHGRFSVVVFSVANSQDLKARHGAEQTSRLLREVEGRLRGMVRQRAGDLVVRWRYGEVVIVLAEVDKGGAQAMAQRLQRLLQAETFTVGSQPVTLAVTVAMATYPDEGLTEQELLALAAQRLQRPAGPSKTRVLVVDDEPKIRGYLKEALELRDFEVLTAASGPEALEQLKRQRVHLVLLDLMMPVMDGYEVYHLLKENPRTADVPVIIVTAKGERKDRELGLNGAAYHYVEKPFELDDLLAKMHAVLT